MQVPIRALEPTDSDLLLTATWGNLNWSGPRFTIEEVRSTAEFAHYARFQPARGDFGLVALVDGAPAGAGWALFLPASNPGYGFVSPLMPEASLWVRDGVRRRGIGRQLVEGLQHEAVSRGVPGLSLSVEAGNPAKLLYERLGFAPHGADGTMVWHAPSIRTATTSDIPVMQRVDVKAGSMFLDIGLDEVSDDEPIPAEILQTAIDARRAWVALIDDELAAFAVASIVDGHGHLLQISTDPAYGRRGLGRLLIEQVMTWAAANDLPEVSLTTFVAVPWNLPYYQRLGFIPVAPEQTGPQLRAIREDERAQGLDRWPRTAMTRAVPDPEAAT